LAIERVEKEDFGPYSCMASNSAGKEELVIAVKVILPPQMKDPEARDDVSVVKGEILLLRCPVISLPTPTIKWFHNGRPIVEQNSRQLRIAKVDESHAGTYICAARNEAGESRKTFNLEILMAPQRDESVYKRRVEVLEGGRVKIGCPVKGVPAPSVKWLTTRRMLEPDQEDTVRQYL